MMSESDAAETITKGDEVYAAGSVDDQEIHVPLLAEDLTATTRSVEGGAARIEKRVVSEDRALDVPATDEQIRVERRIVDRPGEAGELQSFEQITIEAPLLSDGNVRKQARVTDEIVVTKETVQRTERVTDTVRREVASVEGDIIPSCESASQDESTRSD